MDRPTINNGAIGGGATVNRTYIAKKVFIDVPWWAWLGGLVIGLLAVIL
jgi:uncharacterized membrane protein